MNFRDECFRFGWIDLFFRATLPTPTSWLKTRWNREEADREVLSEVMRLVHRDGNSLDDALASVVREDFFRHFLCPKARIEKPRLFGKDGQATIRLQPNKRAREPTVKKGDCFDWAEGRCTRGDKCKFRHPDGAGKR